MTSPVARPYHHGALRGHLLGAAIDRITRDGAAAVSLRQLARDVGVSPAAPYHHFEDRSALYVALVKEGYITLIDDLIAAREAAPDAVAALTGMVVAYADFAASHPAHIRVILRPELIDATRHSELALAGEPIIDLMRAAVSDAQTEGAIAAGDPEPMLHVCWSMAVGYVTLWIDGPVEARCTALGTTPEEFAASVAGAVEGLLRRPMA